ncbi:MAG: M1 family metallopeptidase [Bacteroidota bacterium]|nr:M1 family metallopeptidase [Bacteroidota bacterium]
MNKVLAIASLIFIPFKVHAQTQAYFQQRVDHEIKVELDDVNHELNAEIKTIYTNNSPEALGEIWMHLWPNAYSSGKTALARQQYRNGNLLLYYAYGKALGGISDLDFKVNGDAVQWEFDLENPDIAVIHLNSLLQPGESLEIHTPFKVRIPSGKISRMGHIGQSYQITQWYPKPAVYDRDGWHVMPYLDQGEFYSEYGIFDVYLTIPENYTVGATGDMPKGDFDNDTEIARLNELDKNTRHYFENQDEFPGSKKSTKFPESSDISKTLHYHQENVHDFAWFADKRYKVLKDSVQLPHSGRYVVTWAMFTENEQDLWRKSPDYLNKSIYCYSLWNGDYPYNHVTAVDGTISAGGGMEYPNVTVIGESGTDFALNTVIAHEVGHNWFYGILGSNERENAWMDEGLNSFNETRYLMEYYEGKDLGLVKNNVPSKLATKLGLEEFEYRWIDELSYLFPARLGIDQPLQCHSDDFSSINYGAMVYKKTAAVFGFMRQYLGDERFDRAMQTYFNDWKFKHPSPSDLQNSMERSSGEDLSWFFEGWIKTNEKNNWAVYKAKKSDESVEIIVKNVGGQTSPAEIVLFNDTVRVGTVWAKPTEPGEKATVVIPSRESTHVIIDPKRYDLDFDRTNNYSKTSGIFKKVEPLQFKMYTRLEDGNRSQLFWIPISGWNAHSGHMLGLGFHNMSLPMKNLEWNINPMIGIKNGANFNGIGSVSYSYGKWYSRFRVSRFMSRDMSNVHSTMLGTETAANNRISYELKKKFKKAVNSSWSSNLSYEYVRRFGFVDNFYLKISPYRESYKLRFEAKNTSTFIVDLKQSLGLEARYFNLQRYSGLSIEPPEIIDNENIVIMANYTISRRCFEDKRANGGENKSERVRISLLGAHAFNLNGYEFKLSTNGFNAGYDPMGDLLLLDRGRNGGFYGAQAPNLYGALPVDTLVSNWFASARLDWELGTGLSGFAGYLFTETETNLVAGFAFNLGFLNIQMPLYSNQIHNDEEYNPWKYWTFGLNLIDLNPSKVIRSSL